jgi:hypothetical protein
MMRFETRHSQVMNLIGSGHQLTHLLRGTLPTAHHAAKPVTHGVELGLNDVIYSPPATAAWREAWSVTEDQIVLMNREVEAHGALLLVATVPSGIQDDPKPVARAKYMKLVHGDNIFYPDDRIRELGEKHGFAVLNLPKPMQEYAEAHQAYLHGFANTNPGVGHWNVEGHEVAGTLLGERIRQLLDESARPPSASPTNPAGESG